MQKLNTFYSQSDFVNYVKATATQAGESLTALAKQAHALATPIIERVGQFAAANSAILQYTGIAVAATLALVIALKILKAYSSPEDKAGPARPSPSEGEAHSVDPASALTSESFSTGKPNPTPPPTIPSSSPAPDKATRKASTTPPSPLFEGSQPPYSAAYAFELRPASFSRTTTGTPLPPIPEEEEEEASTLTGTRAPSDDTDGAGGSDSSASSSANRRRVIKASPRHRQSIFEEAILAATEHSGQNS